MKNIAIIILLVGILMTVFTGFSVLKKEKVIDLGSVEVTTTKKTPVYWSPITGLTLVAIGCVVLAVSKKQ